MTGGAHAVPNLDPTALPRPLRDLAPWVDRFGFVGPSHRTELLLSLPLREAIRLVVEVAPHLPTIDAWCAETGESTPEEARALRSLAATCREAMRRVRVTEQEQEQGEASRDKWTEVAPSVPPARLLPVPAEELVVIRACGSAAEAELFAQRLAAEGIDSQLSRDSSPVLPETAVLRVRAEMAAAARAALEPPESGGDEHRCEHCNELSPAHFEICWRCQSPLSSKAE